MFDRERQTERQRERGQGMGQRKKRSGRETPTTNKLVKPYKRFCKVKVT